MDEAKLVLGNTAAPASDKKRYNWTLYVRGATEYVDSVTIKLHPTFKNPVRTCETPPFEFKSCGWGTFAIDVLINWKNGKVLRTTWELQFGFPDINRDVPVPAECKPVCDVGLMLAVPVPPPTAAGIARGRTTEAVAAGSANDRAESTHSDITGLRGGGIAADSDDESENEGLAGPEPEQYSHDLPIDPLAPPELLRTTSSGTSDDDPSRAAICARLRETPFLPHDHPLFTHGRGYNGPARPPKVVWKSDKPPRKDHSCPKWLTATEFQDLPDVMAAKVKQLAALIRLSRKTVAYTGAGISAAVIGQAALSGENKVGWKDNTRAAPPTFTHHALGFLGREGLLHGWVQQNHDGLPQKAGFPQERINEIHGSWYDPGNPVVKYSGSLHSRSYPWMREDAQTADLVIVLGTSLGGLNADQVATSTAERTLLLPAPPLGVLAPGSWLRGRPPGKAMIHKGQVIGVSQETLDVRFQIAPCDTSDDDSEEEDDRLDVPVTLPLTHPMELLPAVGGGLGTVCMNLQQTAQDGKMTLRLFGKSDDILRMLLQELGFDPKIAKTPVCPKVSRALVPYGADGRRLSGGRQMWLDLRKGQEVRITPGHNIQGAKQPQYMHIGATRPVTIQGETRQPGVGLGVVVNRSDETCSFILRIEGVQMRLGIWWLESAIRGGVEVLPVVNREPVFQGEAG